LVREAESLLTKEEKQRILERKHAEENAQSEEQTLSSQGEGPSKGKGVNPRNWGDLDLGETEIDVDAQREALLNWARTRDWSRTAPRDEPEPDGESDKENEPVKG
ncbi:hypothetical protein BD769DRAFT_1337304, partial [Suillus cothurnatus]